MKGGVRVERLGKHSTGGIMGNAWVGESGSKSGVESGCESGGGSECESGSESGVESECESGGESGGESECESGGESGGERGRYSRGEGGDESDGESGGESGGKKEVRDLGLTGSFVIHHTPQRGLVLAGLPTAKIPPHSQGTHQPVEGKHSGRVSHLV